MFKEIEALNLNARSITKRTLRSIQRNICKLRTKTANHLAIYSSRVS